MKSSSEDTGRNALTPHILSRSVETKPDNPGAQRISHDGLWTVKELAQYLRMSERWIHERTRRDEIPCHRLGTALRFDPLEVHVWMLQRRESVVGGRGAV